MKNTTNWKLGLSAAGFLDRMSGACLIPQLTPASAQTVTPMPILKQRKMEKHP